MIREYVIITSCYDSGLVSAFKYTSLFNSLNQIVALFKLN